MSESVEAIAAGLSEAMRFMLVAIRPDQGLPNRHLNWLTLSALRRRGLCEGRQVQAPANQSQYREFLTPLGAAVRENILRSTQP